MDGAHHVPNLCRDRINLKTADIDHHPRVFTKPNKAPGHQDLVDRYAILQRKVHDLEQLHADGRKAVRDGILSDMRI